MMTVLMVAVRGGGAGMSLCVCESVRQIPVGKSTFTHGLCLANIPSPPPEKKNPGRNTGAVL